MLLYVVDQMTTGGFCFGQHCSWGGRWEGELFRGKWALENKILKIGFKELQRMVKFYTFLKKSTEFISMIAELLVWRLYETVWFVILVMKILR